MPKIPSNDKEKARRVVRACISNNMELYHISEEDIALKLGFTPRTFRNKRDSPETFTADELWKLSQVLKFTPIQNASIIAGRALTSKEVKEFILL